MPPRRRRSQSRSRGAPRRKTAWLGGITNPLTVGPGGQATSQLTTELPTVAEDITARQGLTVLRIFMTLRMNSTDANLSAEATFGLIMMDGDARSAGAFPDPVSDVDAPWMYWERRVLLPPSDSQQHLMLDIKAKRRFRGNDDGVQVIIDNDDPAQSLEFALGVRMLLALP